MAESLQQSAGDPPPTLDERILRSLETVRPFLQADGGDVEYVRFRPEGILEVRWVGMCAVCPMSRMTLRAGIERAVMNDVPEVKRVESV
jgi:Fe-S cluster biogenesis protein NfuA